MKFRDKKLLYISRFELLILSALLLLLVCISISRVREVIVISYELLFQKDLDNIWWSSYIFNTFFMPLSLVTIYYIDYLFLIRNKNIREIFAVNILLFWIVSNHYIRLLDDYQGYYIPWDNLDFIQPITDGYGTGSLYGTNYPPLAVILFRWLHQFVISSDGKENYIAITYIQNLFLIFVVLCLAFLFHRWIREFKYSYFYVGILFLTSSILFCFCRMNIMFIALIFTMFFLLGYRNTNIFVRFFSLLSLAIAANIKYFPAIFGLLLIKEKRWKEGVVCAFLGIVLFLSPMLIPHNNVLVSNSYNNISEDKDLEEVENEGNEIQLLIRATAEFGNSSRTLGRTLSTKSIVYNILKPFGIEKENSLTVGNIILIVNSVFLLFGFFVVPRRDYELLILSVFAILLVPTSNWYFTMFLLIPFLEFLKIKEYSRLDALNMLIWIDIFTYRWGFCNKFYLQDWRELLLLWIFIIFVILKEAKNKIREKKSEGCNFSWW